MTSQNTVGPSAKTVALFQFGVRYKKHPKCARSWLDAVADLSAHQKNALARKMDWASRVQISVCAVERVIRWDRLLFIKYMPLKG